MKEWILYRHTSPSGKVYIGITSVTPQRRWANGNGYKRCVLFQKAIIKYGWDSIKHEVLFTGLTEERAKTLEISLIRHYKGLGISYNITDGGDGALGRVTSEETKAKMRARKIGKPLSEEHREKIRRHAEKLKGIPRTEEVKRKLHEANKGKKPSPQTIKASKEYHATHPIPKERIIKLHEGARKKGYKSQTAALNRNREQIGIKHRKGVIQFSLQGEYIMAYEGITFAGKATNVDSSTITACCKGKQYRAGGYLWMYESDYNKALEKNALDVKLKEMVISASKVPGTYERTEEWRRKKSESQKGMDTRSAQTKLLMQQKSIESTSKAIEQLSLDNLPIRTFRNGNEIKKELGFCNSYISKCCRGEKEQAYGYKWRFVEVA